MWPGWRAGRPAYGENRPPTRPSPLAAGEDAAGSAGEACSPYAADTRGRLSSTPSASAPLRFCPSSPAKHEHDIPASSDRGGSAATPPPTSAVIRSAPACITPGGAAKARGTPRSPPARPVGPQSTAGSRRTAGHSHRTPTTEVSHPGVISSRFGQSRRNQRLGPGTESVSARLQVRRKVGGADQFGGSTVDRVG